MKVNKTGLLLSLFIGCIFSGQSQCLMMPLSLSERVAKAELIAEGRVLDQYCFESNREGHIYTANLIQTGLSYKGGVGSSYIYLITQGGEVGNRSEIMTPSLRLHKGDNGIFFCIKSSARSFGGFEFSSYGAYGEAQGFIWEEAGQDSKAYDVFHTYDKLSELRDSLNWLINGFSGDFSAPNGSGLISPIVMEKQNQNPVITSLSPATIPAGTASVLTINGSGFGQQQGTGKVSFTSMNGNGSFVDALASQYLSWSDNQIRVNVTDGAGSGRVVVTQGGMQSTGTDSIFIPYDIEQWVHNDTAYTYVLADMDTIGGYRWYMNADMANSSGSLAPCLRAMDEWRCNTRINWQYSGTTNIDTSGSGKNVIRFEHTGELAAGVLGTMSWVNQWCIENGQVKTYMDHYDLVVSASYPWCYGPQAPTTAQVDIQTIFSHEFGHAHSLNHVNGPQADFMHSYTAAGVSVRNLSAGNLDGGDWALAHSIGQVVCASRSHIYYVCPQTAVSDPAQRIELLLYPNPVSDRLCISGSLSGGLIRLTDAMGQLLRVYEAADGQTIIDLRSLAAGIYVCSYISNGYCTTLKVMKN